LRVGGGGALHSASLALAERTEEARLAPAPRAARWARDGAVPLALSAQRGAAWNTRFPRSCPHPRCCSRCAAGASPGPLRRAGPRGLGHGKAVTTSPRFRAGQWCRPSLVVTSSADGSSAPAP